MGLISLLLLAMGCANGPDTSHLEKDVLHLEAKITLPGVLYIPRLNRLVVANAADGGCIVYDGATYGELGQVALGDDADNLRYDGSRVYVGYGSGGIGRIPGRIEGPRLIFRWRWIRLATGCLLATGIRHRCGWWMQARVSYRLPCPAWGMRTTCFMTRRMGWWKGARTSLWLPGERKLLVAVPARGGEDAAVWVYGM
ncbi:MAG TPA: hypothetical protein VGN00_02550 [Puia sp.]